MSEVQLLPIKFHYLTKPFYFPRRTFIKELVTQIFIDFSKQVQNLDYIFCSDKYLLALNQNYLKHDYYTDIITFELNDSNQPVIADVFISIDRARENARVLRIAAYNELMRLIIHGALHLCGLKDKSSKEKRKMRNLEDYYLKKCFT